MFQAISYVPIRNRDYGSEKVDLHQEVSEKPVHEKIYLRRGLQPNPDP